MFLLATAAVYILRATSFLQPLVLSVSDLEWLFVGFKSHGLVDHNYTLRVYVSLTVGFLVISSLPVSTAELW